VSVVPRPSKITLLDGAFQITPTTVVVASGGARAEAGTLVEALAPAMGFRLEIAETAEGRDDRIELSLDASMDERIGVEGYRLEVASDGIHLRAVAPAGLFYGVQTLRQLLPPEILSPTRVDDVVWTVPGVCIEDRPRFAWRGLLLDPARHFIPKEALLRFIDRMALHKLNRLQLHLTDDQGWRIEIEKYPRLTEVGAWRDETLVGHLRDEPRRFDGERHGGFYTQDDVREIVRFAAARHVTIVPEIEMPGHARAAISAYPELGVFPEEQEGIRPWARWGVSEDIFAPRPETVAFLRDVLREVMELFPGRYVHIGGDEAVKGQWNRSEEMQGMIRELGLEDEAELQSWFTHGMDAFLTEHGRRLVGWDEILEGGLAPGAVVMSWRGERGGIAAAKAGHDVVMAPTSHTYLDYYQGPPEDEPLAIGGFLPLERVYQYEPVPAELSADEARHVLGAQAQLWSEYIPDEDHLEYMTWPRAAALAEVVWTPASERDYDDFLDRLEVHEERLRELDVSYRPLDRPARPVASAPDPDAPRAARALARRLLGERADAFRFETIPPVRGRDVFEIESDDGAVVIRGNTAGSMATGLNRYLERYCRCQVSLRGRQLDLPDPLPVLPEKVRRVTWARYRYFLNYCCFGYSLPWWDWAQWEELIDWMALHGINAPLAVTGQEAVWRAVGRRMGWTEAQIASFLAGPPYLPFGWMGCLDGWGGPLPASWIGAHEELGKRILARQRELGMTPVLQGFTGHVPAAVAESHPEAKLHQIHWIEWETHLLDPLDPLYVEIAKLYMEEQLSRFGTDHLYAADTFIEMTPPSGEPEFLADLSRAILAGMTATDPEAVWVLQGWIFLNQRHFWTPERIHAFLDAVDDERMLVLDLYCESAPQWNRTEAFCGKPWLWCNVQNFGNNVHLGGALPRIHDDLFAARGDRAGGELLGLGFVNEGLGYNPVVHDFLLEMAWCREAPDLETWIRDYSRARYGRANAAAEKAWEILLRTVYAAPARTRSAIDRVPTLQPIGGPPYDNAALADAWRLLLEASDELGEVDTFRFDLVNVARQVLSNHAADLHLDLVEAAKEKDGEAFHGASERFLQLIQDTDELLATRKEFLLGRWLEDAKRWGTTDEERRRFEWNARRVLTLWGTGVAIRDYARKEWSGMLSGFYGKRWMSLALHGFIALEEESGFDSEKYDELIRQWEGEWADEQDTYPTKPQGDSVEVAARLWESYGEAFSPDCPSLTTGKPVAYSHALPPYPARLANDGRSRSTNAYWATDVAQHPDAWWQVDLERPTTVGRVVVVGYFGDVRHYGFLVEGSLDGETWELLADRRDNEEPSTAAGTTCTFAPRPVRYLRVTQTHNSANTGRHLVEVMAFEE